MPMGDKAMNFSVQEENTGALVLARTLPPQFTLHSKYYTNKTIWFYEDIVKCGIKILKIDTLEQLGDLFARGQTRNTLEYLRRKIMDW